MKRNLYYVPLAFVILAIILAFFGWFSDSFLVNWIAPVFGLAFIAIALGLYSFLIALQTDRRITEMGTTLARIEGLQEEMRKAQDERAGSGTPIVASLEAMSKYYMDYINEQKGEDNK
ncbi:hypothetical protein ACFLXP_05260 [Chloroflexota bacterium]